MKLIALTILAACTSPVARHAAAPPNATELVAQWLASNAILLDRFEAGHGMQDLTQLRTLFGTARIIGAGEATHGTHEFFQLKHRFLEYAVTTLGFTAFGIEAGATECRQIDAYVATGQGDPRSVLRTVPIWNTEEVLALIEWMRAWNQEPAHDRKLRFFGFDMQTPFFAYRSVTAYLTTVAPEQLPAMASFAVLGGDTGGVGDAQWADIARQLELIGQAFDAHRSEWSAASSVRAFEDARHDVITMTQAARVYGAASADPDRSSVLRDHFLADNVEWQLAHEPAGTRMLLWAHNGHVALQRPEDQPMGGELRRRFGRDYLSVGFVFGQGEFRTVELHDRRAVLAAHRYGPPRADDVATPFAAARRRGLIADLRAVPAGVVGEWFHQEHPMREVGGVYWNEEDASQPTVLPAQFDVVVYVDRTTGSRPLD